MKISLLGKSTCISLLLRQYELTSGRIKIDGRSITDYDLKELRQNIGVVSQEPVDFIDDYFNLFLLNYRFYSI